MKTDFLVIGSGIAGLNFALKSAPHGRVTIVTKKEVMESNTNLAQGGIATVTREDDAFQFHIEDTLRVGCDLSNKRIVKILVENGPKEIQSLISLGVNFDKEKDEFHLALEAGHSKKRILHSGDSTGREIESNLIKTAREHKNVEILENCFAINLIVKDGECLGINLLDIQNRERGQILSRATVLATGGVGYIFQNTSNPEIATGDGVAMAFQGGATVEDMEFVQFHPTTLNKADAPNFLISEAFRGEGAILLNDKGERFLEKYDVRGELAPRDVVSRAIFKELAKSSVYLDISFKPANFIVNRFPYIYQECLKYDIDITKDLIPVSPAAHYICGGIKTNEYGETNIRNLLAFGECACTEVHGANRLASNSLLESVVFSSLGATKVKRFLKNEIKEPEQQKEAVFDDQPRQELEILRAELRKAMWDYVGIIRNEGRLSCMLQELNRLDKKVEEISENGLNSRFCELRNMVTVARLITRAAQIRKESRGTHYREDYPFTDEKMQHQHICFKRQGKNTQISFLQC